MLNQINKMETYKLAIIFSIVCVICQANPAPSNENIEKGFYWREYDRDVPTDAFPAGQDSRGKPTYIGQTLHLACGTGMIVTGQVYAAEQKMTYEWGSAEHVTKQNVKILCTRNPEKLEWIKTNLTGIENLNKKNLISGGIEKDCTLYIGRVFADNEIAVGRVVTTNTTKVQGLFTTLNGKYLHVLSSFDLLAYKPTPNLKFSKLKSPGSGARNTVWYPLIATVFAGSFYSVH